MTMKLIRVGAAFAVIVLVIFQVFNAVTPTTYEGDSFEFLVNSGPIIITNDSDTPQTIQVVGTGSRAFRIISTNADLARTSETLGTGADRTQVRELSLPEGVSEFTVERGTNMGVVASDVSGLEATVYPVSSDTRRTYIIAAGVITLLALFFASSSVEHQWINMIRQTPEPEPVVVAPVSSAQGNAARSFGDNRTPKG